MCVYEQLENLLKDIKQAKEDILSTDYENLDRKQLIDLSKMCMDLASFCNEVSKTIESIENEQ